MRILKIALAVSLALLTTACQQMDPTEYGVVFRRLPTFVGGGVAKKVINPGETVILMPWDSVYRFDTKPKDVSWGSIGKGKLDSEQSDFVYSRARDGNEVALAFTVRYQISQDPAKLVQLVESTASSEAGVRRIVVSVGQSAIRQYMNELHTSAFLDTTTRYKAVDKVRAAMRDLLEPSGIEIVQVNLDDYRFERKLKDGAIDASYQQRLTEIQQLTEDTERERSRMETMKAQKDLEQKAAEAKKNQLIAEADGYRNQAKLRGDAYFEARQNEAKALLAQGTAEAQGLTEQINALSGSGGEALLKLEIAKQLLKSDPKFVVMGRGKTGGGVDINKLDTNELLQQLGLIEGLRDQPARAQMGTVDPVTPRSLGLTGKPGSQSADSEGQAGEIKR
jgi:regulator of protease activity HflC (stomatin/prohibitin superfamily)